LISVASPLNCNAPHLSFLNRPNDPEWHLKLSAVHK
jgi:hypothetical protein